MKRRGLKINMGKNAYLGYCVETDYAGERTSKAKRREQCGRGREEEKRKF